MKARLKLCSTDAGIQSDLIEGRSPNVARQRFTMCDPGSNVNNDNERALPNEEPKTVNDEGMQNDFSQSQSEKASRPMCSITGLASNVTDDNLTHKEKQKSPNLRTRPGMQTDFNDMHSKKASFSI
jgi:hypothetical protein